MVTDLKTSHKSKDTGTFLLSCSKYVLDGSRLTTLNDTRTSSGKLPCPYIGPSDGRTCVGERIKGTRRFDNRFVLKR